jgi:glycerophosphoryl diester phosphodiesterase
MNIEIKTESVCDDAAGGIEEQCVQLVEKYGITDDIIFSSFDPRAVAHLRTIAPQIKRAILYHAPLWKKLLPSEIIAQCGADAFNCADRELSMDWIADLKKNLIPFNIYTVNDEDSMRRLIGDGVSGIFTNRPDMLKKLVSA